MRWQKANDGAQPVAKQNGLECGAWRIPTGEIRKAALFSYCSPILRIPGYILTVETAERTFHFGLNGWGKFWKRELPFPVQRESGRLAFSPVSAIARAIVVLWVAYVLWKWFVSR